MLVRARHALELAVRSHRPIATALDVALVGKACPFDARFRREHEVSITKKSPAAAFALQHAQLVKRRRRELALVAALASGVLHSHGVRRSNLDRGPRAAQQRSR